MYQATYHWLPADLFTIPDAVGALYSEAPITQELAGSKSQLYSTLLENYPSIHVHGQISGAIFLGPSESNVRLITKKIIV